MGQRTYGRFLQLYRCGCRSNVSGTGKSIKKTDAEDLYSCTWLRRTGGRGKDLVHFFNEDGLGAIINSSRGIIAAYKQEAYATVGSQNFAEASRQAVKDMIADIDGALQAAK